MTWRSIDSKGISRRKPSKFRRDTFSTAYEEHVRAAGMFQRPGYRGGHGCLFIDDQEKNVRAAKSVGLATIRFVSAEQLATALSERKI